MPPKMKVAKSHRCSSKTCHGGNCTNPRVILKPFLADPSGQSTYRFSSLPATANLFNKPEFSDVKIKVGEDYYFAHKLVLCSSSDVFAHMLSDDWVERQTNLLELQEEEDCIKVFDRFMYFLYAGNITISESYVIPLFMLADKYNVKPLYEECVKVIVRGLKVYVVLKKSTADAGIMQATGSGFGVSSPQSRSMFTALSSSDDTSDTDDSAGSGEETGERSHSPNDVQIPSPSRLTRRTAVVSTGAVEKHLVASETFPLNAVMKMLQYCHNDRITKAALYNLEARIGNQLCHGSFQAWNELDCKLLVKMLSDRHFCYPEKLLFEAACSWLNSSAQRQKTDTINTVFNSIRFPLLSVDDLYRVEKDDLVKISASGKSLIHDAIRYKLFKDCDTLKSEDKESWSGSQFEPRVVKD